jgi:hypothetical protein
VGSNEFIEIEGCPRKFMREANDFLRIYNWSENGRLGFLYPENGMPNRVAEALDLIEHQVDRKNKAAMERAKRKAKKGKEE